MRPFFHNVVLCVVAVLVAATAISCSQEKEIIREIPVVVHDTVVQKTVKSDSVYIDRYVKEYVKGDTVYLEKFLTKVVERLKTDTISVYTEVPVQTTIEVEKVVEKHLKTWQKALMIIGGISIFFLIIYIIIRLNFD